MENSKPKKPTMDRPNYLGLVFALIPLTGFLVFSIFPAAISFIVSFSNMPGMNLDNIQILENPFDNYIRALTEVPSESGGFWHAVGISFYISLAQVISLCTAIIISVLVNKKIKGQGIFTVVFFIPYICAAVAVAYMWRAMFNPSAGVINTMLKGIFGPEYAKLLGSSNTMAGADYNWFREVNTYVPMLILTISWQAAGYGIVILGASLVAIDKTLYEAAELDGANAWTAFWRITIPQISPTIYFLLTLGILSGLQTFDIPLLFNQVSGQWTAPGPNNMGQTLMVYIYERRTTDMAYASAMSWLLFVFLILTQRANDWLAKRWVYAE